MQTTFTILPNSAQGQQNQVTALVRSTVEQMTASSEPGQQTMLLDGFEQMLSQLDGQAAGPLERLLAQEISVSWVELARLRYTYAGLESTLHCNTRIGGKGGLTVRSADYSARLQRSQKLGRRRSRLAHSERSTIPPKSGSNLANALHLLGTRPVLPRWNHPRRRTALRCKAF